MAESEKAACDARRSRERSRGGLSTCKKAPVATLAKATLAEALGAPPFKGSTVIALPSDMVVNVGSMGFAFCTASGIRGRFRAQRWLRQ